MKVVSGGITAAKGFLASGLHCGIKYKNKDLALIYSTHPCLASGVFTQNKVQAAPLKVTKNHLKQSKAQAIVVNSGNANCCTGKQGIDDAQAICRLLAKRLSIKKESVLIASTGIIGQRLPLIKIKDNIGLLTERLSSSGGLSAAQAIMTTDTKPKQIAVQVRIGKARVKIGAMAKGAGMIHPHLATMLAFITTDALIDKARLNQALQKAAEHSFNLITVDGDTSTNDMVLFLANGLARNKLMNAQQFQRFEQALQSVCLKLAKMIVEDAEGATKFVEICVQGAKNIWQGKKVAFKIANSALVKSAIFGQNSNWGRIAACVGAADCQVKQERLNIYLDKEKVMQGGAASKINKARIKRLFKRKYIKIAIDLGLGKFTFRVFTCDLSDKYIKINARY